MVRYTKGGSWQGYRGNTVCIRCVDELLPFPAIYPGNGLMVNYGSLTQCSCKCFHPWPLFRWFCRWGRGENITPTNSSIIYVQTVCSSSNYHSASSSQGALWGLSSRLMCSLLESGCLTWVTNKSEPSPPSCRQIDTRKHKSEDDEVLIICLRCFESSVEAKSKGKNWTELKNINLTWSRPNREK